MLAGFQNKSFGLFRIGTGHEPANLLHGQLEHLPAPGFPQRRYAHSFEVAAQSYLSR